MPNQQVEPGTETAIGLLQNAVVPQAPAAQPNQIHQFLSNICQFASNNRRHIYTLIKRLLLLVIMDTAIKIAGAVAPDVCKLLVEVVNVLGSENLTSVIKYFVLFNSPIIIFFWGASTLVQAFSKLVSQHNQIHQFLSVISQFISNNQRQIHQFLSNISRLLSDIGQFLSNILSNIGQFINNDPRRLYNIIKWLFALNIAGAVTPDVFKLLAEVVNVLGSENLTSIIELLFKLLLFTFPTTILFLGALKLALAAQHNQIHQFQLESEKKQSEMKLEGKKLDLDILQETNAHAHSSR